MGREVKRVALDFNWPMNKVWNGFLNPHYADCKQCSSCEGMGMAPWAVRVHEQWHGSGALFHPSDSGLPPLTADNVILIEQATAKTERDAWHYGSGPAAIHREAARLADLFNGYKRNHLTQAEIDIMIEGGSLDELKHVRLPDGSWVAREGTKITPEIYTATSISSHYRQSYTPILEALVPTNGDYTCKECGGEGSIWSSPDAERLADEWEPIQPPEGEGWQLWETVSEGSPVSPIFATAEELASWLAGPESSEADGVNSGTSRDQWLKFLQGPGWAPSLIGIGGNLMGGVQGIMAD